MIDKKKTYQHSKFSFLKKIKVFSKTIAFKIFKCYNKKKFNKGGIL